MKRFIALARVSSREQEREGFSLAVQEEALRRYAALALKVFELSQTLRQQWVSADYATKRRILDIV